MRLLLDTHAFLWFVEGNPQMGVNTRRQIEEPANDKWMSLVSVWELAIKTGIGKLTLAERPDARGES